ncbi:helix-turn-helix domain-containing protein [Saccharicrinis sp. GN24d3]|uniref:helix-turn-helix domain-containing protein n=1 Tax=Saccharicrinis sp. GN24d3 TaxID=3458416 RepID=UPI0040352767
MKQIPKYDFNKKEEPLLEFEILRLEELIKRKHQIAGKPHRLDFYQLIFITEGTGIHTVDFQRVQFNTGSFIPIAKDQVQQFHIDFDIKGYVILFTSDFLVREKINYRYLYDFILFNSQLSPVVLQCDTDTKLLIEMLAKAFFIEKEFEQEELLRNYLKIILIRLERTKRSFSQIPSGSSLTLSMQFKEALDNTISYKTKVADVCEILGVNSKKLNAALQLLSNKTAKEYLDERVVLEIKRLLSYSELSIKEIAYKIGFEDATNLTKYFKKHAGFLPQKFREIHR